MSDLLNRSEINSMLRDSSGDDNIDFFFNETNDNDK